MAETVLPGVSIEVRAEGLIIPLGVTIGTLGVVGTASKGPVDKPVLLGSYAEAQETFGAYDPWIDGASDELTLVRALELAFSQGATTVIAVRVAGAGATAADYLLSSAGGDNVRLTAKSPGTWGNDLSINVAPATENAFIEGEEHPGGAAISLAQPTVVASARNRITLYTDADGITRPLQIRYDGDPGAVASGQVEVNRGTGALTFFAGEEPGAADRVTASYVVAAADAVKVTLRRGRSEEVYTVVSGNDLAADVNRLSAWVYVGPPDPPDPLNPPTPLANAGELPSPSVPPDAFAAFGTGANARGDNGASGADYQAGLEALLNEPAHIIVAAGQDDSFGDELAAHCQRASSDLLKRDRIAVVGSRLGASLSDLQGHTLNSDRVIFVGPGIKVNDRAATPPVEVTLPGAYTAAAVAGLIASFEPHVSPTNKVLPVGGLERVFTTPELRSLVQSRVLALEKRDGFRIVKGITSSTDTAWHQITTRRIVDYAKAGVRSAANPFIGKLNNERVRGALRSSINSFLADMIESEMLISYELDVSATRQQEIRGIVQVTMVLRPTFSIDFIRVTIFLE
jgi:hypothetical protein